ncbi:MAG: hypothetical protein E7566_02610 [Ruminococcaceae bacterium]|nr:hypothetical protein [Oscillospiraceae bacterium]
MGKALSSWSGMRKYLEQEMLAPSLHGRIRYACKSYHFNLFEVYIDSKLVKQFSWETAQTYINKNSFHIDKNLYGEIDQWGGFWKIPITERTEYAEEEFCDALKEYRSQDIHDSINSQNPIIRMFAILDRRIGKRTLLKLKEDISNQPLWLQEFYRLRIESELYTAT